MEQARYVIVGAGLAGGNAATAIRKKDAKGRVVVVTDEPHRPYDRVPLSKEYLRGEWGLDDVFLEEEKFYEEKGIELVTGRHVQKVDVKGSSLSLDDGREFGFERLLFAAGARPRVLQIPGSDLGNIHYLRTISDSDAIKAAIRNSRRAVIVGGGFIGCEIAAACLQHGLETIIIEIQPQLLGLAFDPDMARWMTDFLALKGAKVMTGTGASRFVGENGRFAGVETATGERFDGDFAAVGIGVIPNDELARDAGLKVDKGIVVNERMETDVPGIFAAGDVARFYSPTFERHLRVEHWDVAVKQGKVAGANMAGAQLAYADPPYFFSDMFELHTHVYGTLSEHDQVVRRGEMKVTERGGFAQFYLRKGRLMAYLGVNRKFKEEKAAQKLIVSKRTIDDVSALEDESKDLQSLLK